MTKRTIFTIAAAWDDETSVWTGHCDEIPAAADAPTLDVLLEKITAMALDLLPKAHPEIDPASLHFRFAPLNKTDVAALMRKLVPEGVNLLDDLFAERRREFEREEREAKG